MAVDPILRAVPRTGFRTASRSKQFRPFRKILDPRGRDVLSLLYPLARAGFARAAALAGDSAAAAKSYSEFLTEWKDADGGLTDLMDARRAVAGDLTKR